MVGDGDTVRIASEVLEYGTASAYPVIEQISSVAGAVTGTAAVIAAPFAFVKWLRNVATAKPKNQIQWMLNILAREGWNISEFSELFSMEKEQAIKC